MYSHFSPNVLGFAVIKINRDKEDLQMWVCGILRSSKLSEDITKEQALKEMRNWKDPQEDYDRKVRELLYLPQTTPKTHSGIKISRKLGNYGKAPSICGLHNESVPIVSCTGSPSHQHIASIISPLAVKTTFNSKHFAETMRDVTLGEDELLVSFNVSSLFTNVPIGEAVQVIQAKLREDDSLAERTPLSSRVTG